MLICPDEVLREVAIQRPANDRELLNIKGFTQRMFNKAGKEFLETISSFSEKPGNKFPEIKGGIPKNIKETLNLLKKGYTLKDIASLRKLSEAVISMQVETIIEYQPDTDVQHLFEKGHLAIINDEIKKGFSDLKELKKRLPNEIGYPLIRIAVAMEKFNHPFSS
jgi:ATP-dependent DNA helicase RecQ